MLKLDAEISVIFFHCAQQCHLNIFEQSKVTWVSRDCHDNKTIKWKRTSVINVRTFQCNDFLNLSMEKQPLLGFRRGIHNSENPGREHASVRGAPDADVTVVTERANYFWFFFYWFINLFQFTRFRVYDLINNVFFSKRAIWNHFRPSCVI